MMIVLHLVDQVRPDAIDAGNLRTYTAMNTANNDSRSLRKDEEIREADSGKIVMRVCCSERVLPDALGFQPSMYVVM